MDPSNSSYLASWSRYLWSPGDGEINFVAISIGYFMDTSFPYRGGFPSDGNPPAGPMGKTTDIPGFPTWIRLTQRSPQTSTTWSLVVIHGKPWMEVVANRLQFRYLDLYQPEVL